MPLLPLQVDTLPLLLLFLCSCHLLARPSRQYQWMYVLSPPNSQSKQCPLVYLPTTKKLTMSTSLPQQKAHVWQLITVLHPWYLRQKRLMHKRTNKFDMEAPNFIPIAIAIRTCIGSPGFYLGETKDCLPGLSRWRCIWQVEQWGQLRLVVGPAAHGRPHMLGVALPCPPRSHKNWGESSELQSLAYNVD